MTGLVVLAVDPGREKCGIAVVAAGPERVQRVEGAGSQVLVRAVVPARDLALTAAQWAREFGVTRLALGDRTGREEARAALAGVLPGLSIIVLDEAGTTEAARARYFMEHPPRGWRRLVPIGMQVPPEPYDDYVAVLLAERLLGGQPPDREGDPHNAVSGSLEQEEKT